MRLRAATQGEKNMANIQTLEPSDTSVEHDGLEQQIVVEQQKLSPLVKDYVAALAENHSFTKDTVMDSRRVVAELEKFWPKLPRWNAQASELWSQIDATIHAIPTIETSPTVLVRVAVASSKLAPQTIPEPKEAAVVATFDSRDGVFRRYVMTNSENAPAMDEMNISSGLMVICQPVPPLINAFSDSRPYMLAAGQNLYSERVRDKPLSFNEISPDEAAQVGMGAGMPYVSPDKHTTEIGEVLAAEGVEEILKENAPKKAESYGAQVEVQNLETERLAEQTKLENERGAETAKLEKERAAETAKIEAERNDETTKIQAELNEETARHAAETSPVSAEATALELETNLTRQLAARELETRYARERERELIQQYESLHRSGQLTATEASGLESEILAQRRIIEYDVQLENAVSNQLRFMQTSDTSTLQMQRGTNEQHVVEHMDASPAPWFRDTGRYGEEAEEATPSKASERMGETRNEEMTEELTDRQRVEGSSSGKQGISEAIEGAELAVLAKEATVAEREITAPGGQHLSVPEVPERPGVEEPLEVGAEGVRGEEAGNALREGESPFAPPEAAVEQAAEIQAEINTSATEEITRAQEENRGTETGQNSETGEAYSATDSKALSRGEGPESPGSFETTGIRGEESGLSESAGTRAEATGSEVEIGEPAENRVEEVAERPGSEATAEARQTEPEVRRAEEGTGDNEPVLERRESRSVVEQNTEGSSQAAEHLGREMSENASENVIPILADEPTPSFEEQVHKMEEQLGTPEETAKRNEKLQEAVNSSPEQRKEALPSSEVGIEERAENIVKTSAERPGSEATAEARQTEPEVRRAEEGTGDNEPVLERRESRSVVEQNTEGSSQAAEHLGREMSENASENVIPILADEPTPSFEEQVHKMEEQLGTPEETAKRNEKLQEAVNSSPQQRTEASSEVSPAAEKSSLGGVSSQNDGLSAAYAQTGETTAEAAPSIVDQNAETPTSQTATKIDRQAPLLEQDQPQGAHSFLEEQKDRFEKQFGSSEEIQPRNDALEHSAIHPHFSPEGGAAAPGGLPQVGRQQDALSRYHALHNLSHTHAAFVQNAQKNAPVQRMQLGGDQRLAYIPLAQAAKIAGSTVPLEGIIKARYASKGAELSKNPKETVNGKHLLSKTSSIKRISGKSNPTADKRHLEWKAIKNNMKNSMNKNHSEAKESSESSLKPEELEQLTPFYLKEEKKPLYESITAFSVIPSSEFII